MASDLRDLLLLARGEEIKAKIQLAGVDGDTKSPEHKMWTEACAIVKHISKQLIDTASRVVSQEEYDRLQEEIVMEKIDWKTSQHMFMGDVRGRMEKRARREALLRQMVVATTHT